MSYIHLDSTLVSCDHCGSVAPESAFGDQVDGFDLCARCVSEATRDLDVWHEWNSQLIARAAAVSAARMEAA